MPIAHALASGMGGVRTAGDLVARMQLARGMRLKEAKEHVAAKLGVTAAELSDPLVMGEVRTALGLGRIMASEACRPGDANAIEAKFNIAEILGIPINCVERFRERTRRAGG